MFFALQISPRFTYVASLKICTSNKTSTESSIHEGLSRLHGCTIPIRREILSGNFGNVQKLEYRGNPFRKTVRNYISSIFSKLQVVDRAQAIIHACEAGLEKSSIVRNVFGNDLETNIC